MPARPAPQVAIERDAGMRLYELNIWWEDVGYQFMFTDGGAVYAVMAGPNSLSDTIQLLAPDGTGPLAFKAAPTRA